MQEKIETITAYDWKREGDELVYKNKVLKLWERREVFDHAQKWHRLAKCIIDELE